ncbi:putative DNA-directed RNA polymerases I and III subunit RPAC2-like [Sesbania bispinosa]|nr:putative DNA-directed RNA polymerases I and III subunit RPAC2-like [Sesbania bispinosa]
MASFSDREQQSHSGVGKDFIMSKSLVIELNTMMVMWWGCAYSISLLLGFPSSLVCAFLLSLLPFYVPQPSSTTPKTSLESSIQRFSFHLGVEVDYFFSLVSSFVVHVQLHLLFN